MITNEHRTQSPPLHMHTYTDTDTYTGLNMTVSFKEKKGIFKPKMNIGKKCDMKVILINTQFTEISHPQHLEDLITLRNLINEAFRESLGRASNASEIL